MKVIVYFQFGKIAFKALITIENKKLISAIKPKKNLRLIVHIHHKNKITPTEHSINIK
ncbi:MULTISPECIES: hypothetical protein [unclassified Snodgrassella]|uniref:hypothetical protein n=1 Tax=unclassified Snodgrassella TaxID=2625236 RepID=UPI0018DDCDB6|nr:MULTISPECIES: hypothetical protein [unclassified Snodgrassella]MBI0160739.1 hypothetical protein [Snodgrassella sp. W6238H14]